MTAVLPRRWWYRTVECVAAVIKELAQGRGGARPSGLLAINIVKGRVEPQTEGIAGWVGELVTGQKQCCWLVQKVDPRRPRSHQIGRIAERDGQGSQHPGQTGQGDQIGTSIDRECQQYKTRGATVTPSRGGTESRPSSSSGRECAERWVTGPRPGNDTIVGGAVAPHRTCPDGD